MDLPEIDREQVYKRLYQNLSTKHSETEYQVAHLELLAEGLRDQRDALQRRVTELEAAQTLASESDEPDYVNPEN